ncbi:hypothetical protein [Priestia koreensis]|uniref:hypothetical protein n=1 Tax=Priestia koreensis TaxID=284581 RepID=UPI0028F71926|nr:hypothetical protein [Priestia koreensis]
MSESGEIPQEATRRGSSPLTPWKAKQSVTKGHTIHLTHPMKVGPEWKMRRLLQD